MHCAYVTHADCMRHEMGASHPECPARLAAIHDRLVFDGHRADDMGNLGLVEADDQWGTRELLALARRHCAGRLVSPLEGGYELNSLARSVAAHVSVLIGAD